MTVGTSHDFFNRTPFKIGEMAGFQVPTAFNAGGQSFDLGAFVNIDVAANIVL